MGSRPHLQAPLPPPAAAQALALWRRLFSSGEAPKHGWGKFYPKGKPPRQSEGTAKAAAKGADQAGIGGGGPVLLPELAAAAWGAPQRVMPTA